MRAKYDVKELLGVGFTLLVLAIGIAYGLEIMGDTRDDLGTADCSGSGNANGHIIYNTALQKCVNSTYGTTDNTSTAVNTAEFNGTVDGLTGVAKIPAKIPTIATVVLAAVIIGILVTYLWARFAR